MSASLSSPKKGAKLVPGKFDPSSCSELDLPSWSHKSVDQLKTRSEVLSASLHEARTLFHKETKLNPAHRLNSSNMPNKYVKPSPVPSPKRRFPAPSVQTFPVGPLTKLRTYQPLQVSDGAPSIPMPLGASSSDGGLPSLATVSTYLSSSGPESSLVSSAFIKAQDPRYLKLDDSKIPPLEYYDDATYETRTPEEWLSVCDRGYSPFYNKGEWVWTPCQVQSYNAQKRRYHIFFDSFQIESDVSRLNLRFEGEDAERHQRRLSEALARRTKTKYDLRFEHFISTDSLPVQPMSPAWLESVHARMVSTPFLAEQGACPSLERLGQEVLSGYDLAMRRVSVRTQIDFDPEYRSRYAELGFLPDATEEEAPEHGKIALSPYDYSAFEARVSQSPQLERPEVYHVLLTIEENWQTKIGERLLVDVESMTLPCTLESLAEQQRRACDETITLLREKWYLHAKDCILDSLQNTYDFYLANVESYQGSEMAHVMNLLDNVLATYLQRLLLSSVDRWCAFLLRFQPREERPEYGRDDAVRENPAFARFEKEALERAEQEKKRREEEEAKRLEEEKKQTRGDKMKKSRGGVVAQEDFEEATNASGTPVERPPTPKCLRPIPFLFSRPVASSTWGSWQSNLLEVTLIPNDAEVSMSPRAEDIRRVFLETVEHMVSQITSFERMEPQNVPLLYIPQKPLLDLSNGESSVFYVREYISECCARLEDLVERATAGPSQLIERYQAYAETIPNDPVSFAHPFEGVPDLPLILREIDKFYTARENLMVESYEDERFGLCTVHCGEVKSFYEERATNVENELTSKIFSNARAKCSVINAQYEDMMQKVTFNPQSEEELQSTKQFIAGVDSFLQTLNKEVDVVYDQLCSLSRFHHKVPQEEFNLTWSAKKWPKRIKEAAESNALRIDRNKLRMQEALEHEKEQFSAEIGKYAVSLKALFEFGEWEMVEKVVDKVIQLDTELKEAKARVENFNHREEIFGWESTTYPQLKEICDAFQPHLDVWSMAADFKANRDFWLTSSFINLDGNEIDTSVNTWWSSSYKLLKKLEKDYPKPAKVARRLREQTDEFRKNVPVIRALASKALQERHWEQLSEVMGVKIVPDEDLTLNLLVEYKVMEYWEKIQEITMYAEKEYNLEKSLDDMINQWDDIKFTCIPYKTTGTYVIKGVEDVMSLLDDHIVKTQTMMGSPFIAAVKARCKAWEKKLQYAQSLIDEWLMCQRTWMALEPIFGSEDIMRQMPTESRRFQAVDSTWRSTMSETFSYPRVMDAAGKDKLLDKFKGTNKMLDQIQKGLNDYLEVKRLSFPRFYFLANNELLEILSQTKDPRTVQRYLGKCFEGIHSVVFKCDDGGSPDDVTITTMRSSEGERVPLLETVDPNEGANRGNVEKWLTELQLSMRLTVKDNIIRAMHDYTRTPRTQWVLKWPGQVVLNVNQLIWTKEVTEALRENKDDSLTRYIAKLNDQLDGIITLVRGDLTSMDRLSLSALTVIDVHARDVVQLLIDEDVQEESDFGWMAQLRYYWELKADEYERYGKNNNNLLARIVNAEVMYGYEYLGNSTRLVITPLTDRCYRTMMGAVSLDYGGAPAGPAGTGKTETVKDLSKAVAIQCVVFNCSDGLDYLAMAKFFKGLAASGAWACFDEFNRIELEVLSVIAQQLLTILKAKRTKQRRFLFEGSNIPLNPDCNSFITMNPGYAGRSELPDNLQALFRSCAMMVPDYAMIAEIKLYSFGFRDARNMARKLTQVLRLCSEQLSSQKHYDYGMRAVFSILIRAGNLRQERDWQEDLIVLSAIIDVNLPKFTANDIPLFEGILSDLFPGVKLSAPDYGPLIPSIRSCCEAQNLQPKPLFLRSIVQLWETVVVRHGLMVVGETYSGKSSVIRTLAQAVSENQQTPPYTDVKITTLNPKSINQGQLYGRRDENTGEWYDGVLASLFRAAAEDDSPCRQWILFDGPVDAVWIENMNTVLDDNKKLCLNSGEIIKMSNYMTMMFEPADLEEASPATVSRCGMVYLEQSRLGWEALVDSWLAELPVKKDASSRSGGGGSAEASEEAKNEEKEEEEDVAWATAEDKVHLKSLFSWLLPPLLYAARLECPQMSPISQMEFTASCLRLLDCLISEEFLENDSPPVGKAVMKVVESLFVMSAVWSIGAVTTADGRATFHRILKAVTTGQMAQDPFYASFIKKNPSYLEGPEGPAILTRTLSQRIPEGSIYDFQFIGKGQRWQSWLNLIKDSMIAEDAKFTSIVVPTIDTIRTDYLVDLFVNHQKHVLLTGDTGTGKSVLVKNKLLHGLGEDFISLTLNFSAQTSAQMTQDIIEGKLMKRRKGVLGPNVGKRCLIFVDDLNMPMKETYGAQPPIELLRQWMDYQGWYDLKTNEFIRIIDVQFIAAMGPPGGGRSMITQRYVRHFNVVGLVPFDNESLKRIYTRITEWIMSPYPNAYRQTGLQIVEATLGIYQTIAQELLPTPTKSHYTFNLRDLSKVFQGISICSPKTIEGMDELVRLWGHECMRVFHDRLIDDTDRGWFMGKLSDQCESSFGKSWEKQIKGDNEVLVYGNFLEANVDSKPYGEIRDHDRLRRVMEEYLEDYNNMNPTHMNLVLFQNAIEHIARISRVINQPYGNALLVGVGGSGKKSLATMAAFMAEYRLYKIEITKAYGMTEWREDLKKILKMTGQEGKPVMFLFSDTQIVSEAFVEDINNVLNSGDVPNLFDSDEMVQLLEEIAPAAQRAGRNPGLPAEVYSFFIDRSRTNLHLVLAFSPIGDAFRTRLRMFPSLVNCCTIDWFTDWPEEALRSVADYFLEDVEVDDDVKKGVVNICVEMQSRVSRMTQKFLQELQRHFYVTPTSYLELINTFKGLLARKREDVHLRKKRYDNGLQKLLDTQEQVSRMQEDLKELQPKLRVAQEETDQKLRSVETMQRDTEEKQKVVESEARACAIQTEAAETMERECSEQLAVALPAMEAAIAALKTLDKNSLTEVKSMKKPPAGVRLTMECVCILLGVKPKRVFDESGRNKIDDYWEPSQREVLSNLNLLKILQEYDKDHIPEEIIAKIQPYTTRPDFEPAVVYRASLAAGGLCKWARAIVEYDVVAKVVAPKRAALEIARTTLEAASSQLESKRAELDLVKEKMRALEEELNATVQRKLELERKVDECKRKLDRAQRLLGGLGGEQTRWSDFSRGLAVDYDNLVGDILMSSGVIAYLGCFPTSFRYKCIEEWSIQLDVQRIPRSQTYSLAAILGDPILIRKWTINKLPNDSFSIDNAIMMLQSHRWPLMIDPEGQANRWVRNLEGGNNLKVVKQSSNSFVRTLENSIQFGAPVLLENLPESLDPILETILLKQVIKIGGMSSIRIGDNTVTYDDRFKLYMTTRLRNPHYSPETCVKVNLLNFMATQEGLQDQMLGILVGREQEDLERRREQLVLEDAENKRKLKEIEDEILNLLAASEGDILEDEKLIDTLAQSKLTSNQIQIAVSRAESTQREITQVRKSYEPVAERASLLFFCISDLSGVESMYQYSMDWYINLFLMAIDKAPKSKVMSERLTNLNDKFTVILYENVCRSLFQKDKLLFSFLLCNKILISKGELNPLALRYFLAGNVLMSLEEENPVKTEPRWLSDKSWGDILGLKSIAGMESFVGQFKRNLESWREVYFSSDPVKPLDDLLESFTTFQKMLVIKAIRPDKVVPMIQRFISEGIGRRFIEVPSSDLMACYGDSNCCSPLIFILSPGADPMHDLLKLAEKMGMSKKLNSVSLGQGQGPIAEEAITTAVDKGMWVCLQNCHLAESWMPELERICEENTLDSCHPDFRLWLTSMPSSKFPTTVLQNGVKMTTEPPRGLLNNLQGTFSNIDAEWFDRCPKSFEFKKLLFGLAFFHATVIERVRFGPLGWNIPYVFSLSDLQISMDQLMLFLTKYDEINFEMLNYLAGECNYGGRVTDDKDRRCIMNILSDFYTPRVLDDDYTFSPSGIYFAPPAGPLESYLEYIRSLPLNESPEVYGLHENADITCANQETNRLLESVLSLQPRTAGGAGQSWEDTLMNLARNISGKIPDVFDVEKVSIKFPVVYEESLNTVLVQELMRYNGLLSVIKKSLVDIERAIKGFVVMSLDLETMGNSMVNGWVPQKWKAVAYPSLKPLGSWVNDLCARVHFLDSWVENGAPDIFWISGFFFTQSFLTGTRQNFARKYTIPIDEISFDFHVFTRQAQQEVTSRAPDGAYVTGLFLEGANWDDASGTLSESRPKELFVEMPLIHLIPKKSIDIDPNQHVYECPTYKTSERRGVLSTTGHSTNFVLMINLTMSSEHSQKHWIKRGVALLTQLDD